MILGNIEGVKKSVLKELENIYEENVPKDSLFTSEIAELICRISNAIDREISIAINRKGKVLDVSIGDSTTVEMPIIDMKDKKLSGVRIIHTHPNGNPRLSDVDLSALIKLKLDCIAAIGTADYKITGVCLGFCAVEEDEVVPEEIGPMHFEEALGFNYLNKVLYAEEALSKIEELEDDNKEKAILVGVDSEESLEELAELARSCEVTPVMKVMQKKDKIDTAFFIGKGKVEEVALLGQVKKADVIIFDDELSGSQVRNLEETIGTKVIDRTTLILDIFARRAKSREAIIQVELAQLKYRLPRLNGLGSVLSRTGGGIGTRGPGEKKLEVDRRHIRERIYDLENELKKIKKNREVQREKRNSSNLPQISLVGYTNAGKSTLRNLICEIASPKDYSDKEGVFEANMLFATLDVTTRAIKLNDNRTAALTDTVGFVRKLPHSLVESFKSTLEEVVYSDLLIHVVDAASAEALEQIEAVNEVLKELNAADKPTILVLNKLDIASEEQISSIKDEYRNLDIVEISARERINIDTLLNEVCEILPSKTKRAEYIIPYDNPKMAAYIHQNSVVEFEEFKDEGTYIKATVDEKVYNKCKGYMI